MKIFVFSCILTQILIQAYTFEFTFSKGQPRSYRGYLWKDAKVVYFSPRLQAVAKTNQEKLCGMKIIPADGQNLPFEIKLVDKTSGFAELFVKEDATINSNNEFSFVFHIEAIDCSSHQDSRSLVPVQVTIVNRHGPVFDQPSYSFTVSEQSPIGTVVGLIRAIEEPSDDVTERAYSKICGYSIHSEDAWFSINKNGVIHVNKPLEKHEYFTYILQIVAEDCHRPNPRTANTVVLIDQTSGSCQPGWKGLPSDIDYRGKEDNSELLFSPPTAALETCTRRCSNPSIVTQLELRDAVSDQPLETANPNSCLHDPLRLSKQRTICGIHERTLTKLLPDPGLDITSQLIGPPLGSPPKLTAPTLTWRFNAEELSVWEVDPKYITTEAGVNAFDQDFTVSFWIRRDHFIENARDPEREEQTVLCSQDDAQSHWRFFSVGFRKCNVVVRLLAALENEMVGASEDHTVRKETIWTFGPLDDQFCSSDSQSTSIWHHFAITFTRQRMLSMSSQIVTILVDGQDLKSVGIPSESLLPSIPSYIPSNLNAKPRVTVGACFDPESRLTKQHLSGEIAGLTLVLGAIEAPNKLRCLAQCGESLLVPEVMKFLKKDISINLRSDKITVTGQNLSHITDIITAVAYVRPQHESYRDVTSQQGYSRKLKLITEFNCSDSKQIFIPTVEVALNIYPINDAIKHIEASSPLNAAHWIPGNLDQFQRPAVSQVNMEHKALESELIEAEPPKLLLLGSDMIITEPPILPTGIPIFSDLRFGLPHEHIDSPSDTTNQASGAASMIIKECSAWIITSGKPMGNQNLRVRFKQEHIDERIEWLTPEQSSAMDWPTVHVDRNGMIVLRGRKTAGQYEKLFPGFRYWPPKHLSQVNEDHKISIAPANELDLENIDESSVLYSATIGAACSLDSDGEITPQFTVQVIIQNPDKLTEPQARINGASPNAHHVQSDREVRAGGNDALRPVPETETSSKSTRETKNSGFGVVAVSIFLCLVVVCLVAGLLIVFKKRRQTKFQKASAQRPRRHPFARLPDDFGGANLKHDPTLQLTANPMGQVEYTGLGTVRQNVFGSLMTLTPKQSIYSPTLVRSGRRSDDFNSERSIHLADVEEYKEYPERNTFDCTNSADTLAERYADIPYLDEPNVSDEEENREEIDYYFNPDSYDAEYGDYIDEGLIDARPVLSEQDILSPELRRGSKWHMAVQGSQNYGSSPAHL